MEAIITVGMPRSGKTTLANTVYKNHVNINRDDTRTILTGITDRSKYWSMKKSLLRDTEDRVTKYNMYTLRRSAEQGLDVIISDTNLVPRIREGLIDTCEGLGYDVKVVEVSAEWDELMKRNEKLGEEYVNRETMYRMWQLWKNYKNVSPELWLSELEEVYLCDIDGTVADHKGVRGPFDWGRVSLDLPRQNVIKVLHALMSTGKRIVFLSGRDSVCREATIEWLKMYVTNGQEPELYMRPQGSAEKDYRIKRNLYDEYIRPKYNVLGVFDDRNQVVDLWSDMGFTVFNVGDYRDVF